MRRTIYAAVHYADADADAALAFLTAALGARQREVHRDDAGAIHHGEIVIEESIIFIGQFREQRAPAAAPGAGESPLSLYLVVADPDAHHARAVAAGATITRELVDTEYGSREYSVVDPEGNGWSFGTYDPSL
jgi:uncharacterized glyoxalase superfamily protein PhnB